jgi:hypothetical protein
MDMVGRLILRFLLVPLGALVAVLAAVATSSRIGVQC